MEATKWLKPSDSGLRIGDRAERAGRNAPSPRDITCDGLDLI